MPVRMKLSVYRKSKFMTLEELAKKLNVSISAVSLWESGKRTPSLRSQKKIKRITRGQVKPEDFEPVESVAAQ